MARGCQQHGQLSRYYLWLDSAHDWLSADVPDGFRDLAHASKVPSPDPRKTCLPRHAVPQAPRNVDLYPSHVYWFLGRVYPLRELKAFNRERAFR